jgi:hypothetical protein
MTIADTNSFRYATPDRGAVELRRVALDGRDAKGLQHVAYLCQQVVLPSDSGPQLLQRRTRLAFGGHAAIVRPAAVKGRSAS